MKVHAFVVAVAVVFAVTVVPASAGDAGTAFTYQGRLLQDGEPFNGTIELDFDLFDAPKDGTRLGIASFKMVDVVDGLFTVELDYGAEVFDGPRWLEVSLEDVILMPRQRLTPTPFALQTRGIFVRQDRRVEIERSGEAATLELTVGIRTARLQQEDGGDFTIRKPQVGSIRFLENNGTTALVLHENGTILTGTEQATAHLNVASENNAAHFTSDLGIALVLEALSNQAILEVRSAKETVFTVSEDQTFVNGNLTIVGTLSKGAGSFTIDHPLDPANRYLSHSFVESPDMMNIYNGNVTTDGAGVAVVRLPDYFDALNRDFRYQLTVIGRFARAIVAEEIADGRFMIRTDEPRVKVSWQVTGVRRDPYAERHRIEVERDKPPALRGRYLHPVDRGLPAELAEQDGRPAPVASPARPAPAAEARR